MCLFLLVLLLAWHDNTAGRGDVAVVMAAWCPVVLAVVCVVPFMIVVIGVLGLELWSGRENALRTRELLRRLEE